MGKMKTNTEATENTEGTEATSVAANEMNKTHNKNKRKVGVGMPATLWLHEFGSQVWSAFGDCPYLVGSALTGKQWRDVDVRVILSDEVYEAMGLGDPMHPHQNGKWVALCMAFSALGNHMTGLPIDFQIQQSSYANEWCQGPRSALGVVPLRLTTSVAATAPAAQRDEELPEKVQVNEENENGAGDEAKIGEKVPRVVHNGGILYHGEHGAHGEK